MTVDLGAGTADFTRSGESGQDTLVGIERVRDSKGDDLIVGSDDGDVISLLSGGDNTASGGGGNDVLWSGEGADLIDGGAGDRDYVYYRASPTGVTVNLAQQTVAGGYATGDKVSGFTDASGGVKGNDILLGSAVANTLHGQAGNDTISGMDGDDTLRGHDNEDRLVGGDGGYLVYGNQGFDQLFGLDGDDVLYGGQHFDTVHGGQDADIAYGNKAADIVYGGAGNDIVYGGQENDQVFGGAGDDSLFGNRGDDTLNGGAGADRFYIHAKGGHDLIQDFTAGEDLIVVEGFGDLSAAELLTAATITDTAAGVRLSDGAEFSVTLAGQTSNSLSADYFLIL